MNLKNASINLLKISAPRLLFFFHPESEMSMCSQLLFFLLMLRTYRLLPCHLKADFVVVFVDVSGCCFVTYYTRQAAIEAQKKLHNVHRMPLVSKNKQTNANSMTAILVWSPDSFS